MQLDWNFIAPMVVSVALFLTVGGVLVLRPISGRLGALLEQMAKERKALPSDEVNRLREEVETLRSRMELLEERQDFTEGLLGPGSSEAARRPKE